MANKPDSLITDVHGRDYYIQETKQGFFFVHCFYDDVGDKVAYIPQTRIEIITAKTITPLHLHEDQIRKIIAINKRLMVANTEAKKQNYQPN